MFILLALEQRALVNRGQTHTQTLTHNTGTKQVLLAWLTLKVCLSSLLFTVIDVLLTGGTDRGWSDGRAAVTEDSPLTTPPNTNTSAHNISYALSATPSFMNFY